MKPSSITLYELNNMIRELLETQLAHRYWVTAEISEMRTASNHHCYLTLIENSEDGNDIVARASAHIWRTNYMMIAQKFHRAAGEVLTNGIKVLVEVEINFHEVYGYSLNITDLDPSYTLGNILKRMQEILRQLEGEGIIDLNKSLPLPRPLLRIAVISSETAAGYGDFLHQMTQTGYPFVCQLFPAIMQGPKTEDSIIETLNIIHSQQEKWDAVVIIRGGGASSDLWAFDSYLLAANVAQFPLPIITGIGHERDKSILDYVAHTALKTPTAVAAFIIDCYEQEYALIEDLEQQLHQSVTRIIQREQQRIEVTGHRLHTAALQIGSMQEERLLRLKSRISLLAQQNITKAHKYLEQIPFRLRYQAQDCLQKNKIRLDEFSRALSLLDPKNVLKRGFSITTLNGKAVKNADVLQTGQTIVTHFASGKAESRIEHIEKE